MTGFGRASTAGPFGAVTVEVKSVNNRFLKASIRLPDGMAELEAELETIIRGALARGSVYCNVSLERGRRDVSYTLNEAVIRDWLPRLRSLALDVGSPEPRLADMLAMPGVVLEESERAQPDESQFTATREALVSALKHLREMREREGEALARDVSARVRTVASLSLQANERAPQVVLEYRDKLRARLDKLLADSGHALDPATLAREAAMFADRCDISEETTRLAHHCDQFLKVLAGEGEVGRRLDFIAQEMLRETNTLGSKANDALLASVVVQMKSEIEKIKEQVQNLE